MDKVTFYVPCYNAAEHIKECLEGILAQTYPIDEILIIDDGPTDETANIASNYPVTIIKRKEKMGLASARNIAIRKAKNEFVATVDADCLPKKNWLEQLMRNFTNERVAGVGGKLIERYNSSLPDKWRVIHMEQHFGEGKILNPPILYGCNNVFKKDIVVSIGLYDEKFRTGWEDVDLSIRLKEAGYILIYDPTALVEHLRKDSIYSVLETYWRWTFFYKDELNGLGKILHGICLNIKRAKDFFKSDILLKQYSLLYIDLMLMVYHSQMDFKYYISQKRTKPKKVAI